MSWDNMANAIRVVVESAYGPLPEADYLWDEEAFPLGWAERDAKI